MIKDGIKNIIALLKRIMPTILRARFDYCLDRYLKPLFGYSFNAAFNNQKIRQGIFCNIVNEFRFSTIVETGTFKGATAEFFLKSTDMPVYTVEIDHESYLYAKLRLIKFYNCHIFLDNTIDFLKMLSAKPSFPNKDVFFYLDAHGYNKLPLKDELFIIAEYWRSSIVMIDDFKVPDDPGYGYDNYGDGQVLEINYISPLIKRLGLNIFFPSVPSSSETGTRRGCVILSTPDIPIYRLDRINAIKRFYI